MVPSFEPTEIVMVSGGLDLHRVLVVSKNNDFVASKGGDG